MPIDGKHTRNKILEESKALIYENGFAGTSIDLILANTGISKGAFFYHFKSKNILAKALIEEYAREDKAHLKDGLEKTKNLKDNPEERLLSFLQFFIDGAKNLKEAPSCLYASYTIEYNQFDDEIKDVIAQSILEWRKTFLDLLNQSKAIEQSRMKIDLTSLADQFVVIFEGGNIVSKALDDSSIVSKQLQHLKNYLELIFYDKG